MKWFQSLGDECKRKLNDDDGKPRSPSALSFRFKGNIEGRVRVGVVLISPMSLNVAGIPPPTMTHLPLIETLEPTFTPLLIEAGNLLRLLHCGKSTSTMDLGEDSARSDSQQLGSR